MPATKKPGRPPRKPSEKQGEAITVRYTEAEFKALEQRRQRERPDTTLAGFARFLLTGNS